MRSYFDEKGAPADGLAYKFTDQMAGLNRIKISVDSLCKVIGEHADKAGLDLNEKLVEEKEKILKAAKYINDLV